MNMIIHIVCLHDYAPLPYRRLQPLAPPPSSIPCPTADIRLSTNAILYVIDVVKCAMSTSVGTVQSQSALHIFIHAATSLPTSCESPPLMSSACKY